MNAETPRRGEEAGRPGFSFLISDLGFEIPDLRFEI
jgi:hypothetical protein